MGELKKLEKLRLGDNTELTGRLPYSIMQLANLRELNYSNTQLCIPTGSDVRDWLAKLTIHVSTEKECEPLKDRAALVAIFEQMNGKTWRENKNWNTEQPLRFWHGVETDGQGRVTSLGLYDNNLQGTIPREFFELVHLEELGISGGTIVRSEAIYGIIPEEIGGLTQLKKLTINNTNISGQLPASIGKLENLEVLNFYGNALTGSIPQQIENLSNLSSINLSDNSLSGSIPLGIEKLNNLSYLFLSNNKLTGMIPSGIGNIDLLFQIDLSFNDLSGPIPREIGVTDRLNYINFSNNALTGSIPKELGDIRSLIYLLLNHNKLDGQLPKEIANLNNLRSLQLTGNAELSGPLPSEMAGMTSLQDLQVMATELCALSDTSVTNWLRSVPYSRIPTCGYSSKAAYLVQAVQSRVLPIALLGDESATLRVFPTATQGNSDDLPPIRATFYNDDEPVYEIEITGKSGPIPTEIDESSLNYSYNQTIPSSAIKPGLEMFIEIDPEGTLEDGLLQTRHIPEQGRLSVEVKEMPVFDLTLIPFIWEEEPDLSVVETIKDMSTDPETHELLGHTRSLLPIVDISVTAHSPVYTSSNSTYDIYNEVGLIRLMEDGDGHYMGMMLSPIGPVGLAGRGGYLTFAVPDKVVIAHELGHNLNVAHPSCGVHASEFAFPYRNGSIGAWGYDQERNDVISPNYYRDLMSYCSPKWVSDYSFDRMMRHRILKEQTIAASRAVVATKRSLIFWGGKRGEQNIFIEPILVADVRPKFPDEPGPYTIVGLDDAGRHLFAISFHMDEIEGGAENISNLIFALPIKPGWREQLHTVTLSNQPNHLSVSDSSRPSITVFRDAASGQIRGIGRSNEADRIARVLDSEPDWRNPNVIFSDGIPPNESWIE